MYYILPSTYGVVVSVTAHGERGPGFDPGQGRLSFLSEISLNSAMCFANNPFTCGRRCQLREESPVSAVPYDNRVGEEKLREENR